MHLIEDLLKLISPHSNRWENAAIDKRLAIVAQLFRRAELPTEMGQPLLQYRFDAKQKDKTKRDSRENDGINGIHSKAKSYCS